MTQITYTQMLRDTYKKMLLTKRETAKELGVSEASIDRMRKDGLISTKKVLGQVMFSIDEIARFLTEG